MRVANYATVTAESVEAQAAGVTIREVITPDTGAPNFSMRVFEIAPGGYTPHHAHPWEHEVFVLTGSGKVVGPEGARPLSPGSVVLVPPDEEHHFATDGDEPLTLLCLIPLPKSCCG